MKKKASDFRYNTGETKVPWAAVGENYNVEDMMAFIGFLMQGKGEAYEQALAKVKEDVYALDAVSAPPGKLSLDAMVARAEADVDEFLGTQGALFLTNCTAGFEIAYKYANLKPGDEVIVPAITFVATMAYPLSIGCKLVFADVDPITLNMNPRDVEKKITARTKMIVPVDIGGYPADLDPIMELARKHDCIVLEDAAHAFGAEYKGRKIGTIADFTAFSFHEVKNITSFGEGGILTTNIEEFRPELPRTRFLGLDFSRKIRNWLYDISPIPGKYGPFVAGNHSTTEIQALGLSQQVKRNGKILAARREAVEYLNDKLKGCDAILTQDTGEERGVKPTFHLYRLLLDPEKAGGNVQVFKRKMAEKGVTTIPHFGPLYRFRVLEPFGYDPEEIAKTCPVCEDVFNNRFTHFPCYGLSTEQLDYMAQSILEAIDEMQRGV